MNLNDSETLLSLIFNSNMIVMSRFFLWRKVSNTPDPSLHKTCKLFVSQRIIEFILGGPPSIIYPALFVYGWICTNVTRKNFKVFQLTLTYRTLVTWIMSLFNLLLWTYLMFWNDEFGQGVSCWIQQGSIMNNAIHNLFFWHRKILIVGNYVLFVIRETVASHDNSIFNCIQTSTYIELSTSIMYC